MATVRWQKRFDPLADFERELRDIFGYDGHWGIPGLSEPSFPPMNLCSMSDHLLVTVELPGVSIEGVELTVTGETLTIRGERKAEGEPKEAAYHRHERQAGPFTRSIRLPESVLADQAAAQYANGILEIRLPKGPESKVRRIEVKPE